MSKSMASAFETADANGDGIVDRNEWNVVQNSMGRGGGSSFTSSSYSSKLSSASSGSSSGGSSSGATYGGSSGGGSSGGSSSGGSSYSSSTTYTPYKSSSSPVSVTSSVSHSEMHVVKKTREQEQYELHGLNGRLEACIMRQREKDENEAELRREIDNLRRYFEREIETLTASHESAITVVRQKRDQFAEENKVLKANFERSEGMVFSLRQENDDLKLQLKDMQKQLEMFQTQVSEMKMEMDRLKITIQQLRDQLSQAEQARDAALGEVQSIHMKAEMEAREMGGSPQQVLGAKLESLTAELGGLQNQLRDANRALRAEREANAIGLEERAKDIRAELNGKMLEILRERDMSLNDKVTELRIKMEQEYTIRFQEKSDELQRAMERLAEHAQLAAEAEAKLHMIENDPERMVAQDQSARIHDQQKELSDKEKEFRLTMKQLTQKHSRAFQELVAERDSLKARNEQLEAMLDQKEDSDANVHNLTDDLKFWKDECTKMQAQLHTQKELHKTIAEQEALLKGQESLVNTLRAQLAQCNADMAKKDEDYESLLGLKVALDMEIKSYRWLLENEETRLGLDSEGSKKRKTVESFSSSSSSSVAAFSSGSSSSGGGAGYGSSSSGGGYGSSSSGGGAGYTSRTVSYSPGGTSSFSSSSSSSSSGSGSGSGASFNSGGGMSSDFSSTTLSFDAVDTDKSGGITKEEWQKMMAAKRAPY
jgi:Tfp pilus assembly protein PilO